MKNSFFKDINWKGHAILIAIILFCGLATAVLSITQFDNFSSPGNLTFAGDQNITQNLTINKYASVTSSSLNLIGEIISNNFSTIDFYNQTNKDNQINMNSILPFLGQSFTNTQPATLDSVKFFLRKTTTPTENMAVKIYASTGTHGTNAIPTGDALATSDVIASSTLTTSFVLTTFNFSGANRIYLVPNTTYFVVLNFAGNPANQVNLGVDSSSSSHSGNRASSADGTLWTAGTTYDVCFYVYGNTSSSVMNSYLQIGNSQNKSWYLPQANYQGTNVILNNLNDSSASKNLTFTGNQNQTVYLNIPKNANVINSSCNLQGYNYLDDVADITIHSGGGYAEQTLGLVQGASYDTPFTRHAMKKFICGNITKLGVYVSKRNVTSEVIGNLTFAVRKVLDDSVIGTKDGGKISELPFDSYNYKEVTFDMPIYVCEDIWLSVEFPIQSGDGNGIKFYWNTALKWTYYSGGYIANTSSPYFLYHGFVYNSSLGWSDTQDTFDALQNGGRIPEYNVTYIKLNNTLNPYLLINQTAVWNYTGSFNGTNTTNNFNNSIDSYMQGCSADSNGICQVPLIFHSNTAGILQISNININYTNISKTSDFSAELNSAMSNSCSGGTLNGSICIIPFLFHSDTAGILQYSSLQINYTEYPNVTLNSPSSNSVSGANKTFACSATDGIFDLANSTLNIWNSTNDLVNSTYSSLTNLSNSTSINITFAYSDTYHWNCLVCNNDSTCSYANSNNTLIVDVSNPIINQYPITNYFSNSSFNNIFNCSINDGGSLDTAFLYLDDILNETKTAIEGNNIFTKNLTEGIHNWTCAVNKTNGVMTFAQQGNFTYNVDTTFPVGNNISITTITNSELISFTSNITDLNLNICKYTVYNPSSQIENNLQNITFNCNNQTNFSVTSFATYLLIIDAWDKASNHIQQNLSFTTSISTGGQATGGGSASTVTISSSPQWTMTAADGSGSYNIGIFAGIARSEDIIFGNLGSSSVQLTMGCEDVKGSICKYVNFTKKTFTLPLQKDIKTSNTFSIYVPNDFIAGDYLFNIIAVDESSNKGVVSVSTSSSNNFLVKLTIKLSSSKLFGENYKFPYFFILVFSAAILSVAAFFFGIRKLSGGKVWSGIIGVFIACFIVYFW